MAVRAPDIADLEQMYWGGEDEEKINSRAIEIDERLREELKKIVWSRNQSDHYRLQEQSEDFARVLKLIQGRHDHVLDRYNKYLKDRGLKKF